MRPPVAILIMSYTQKILVLKRVECELPSRRVPGGILRVEVESGIAELHLSLVNFTFEHGFCYYALVVDQNGEHLFNLGQKPNCIVRVFETLPDLNGGLCAGVYAVKNDIPELKIFGSTENFKVNLKDFKKIVADKCIEERKLFYKRKEPLIEQSLKNDALHDFKGEKTNFYDDEAVATINYFEFADDISDKLKTIKEQDDGNFSVKDELPYDRSEKEKEEIHTRFDRFQDETPACQFQINKGAIFYQSVREELNALFKKFPPETDLMRNFPESKWVKINYSENKYYVVGLVLEDGREKYICYGVPSTYSKNPPKELKGFCSFIPISIFDLMGKGYWMMFQDATTGACVKM